MPVSDSLVRYFDARAQGYQRASGRWPWSAFRRSEAAALTRLLGPVAGEEVLELGCGSGFYTRLLLENGASRVVAVDASSAMLATLPQGPVVKLQADVAELNLDRRFPLVLSAGLLEFVTDVTAALQRAVAHLEPGGRLVLLVPRSCVAGAIYRRYHRRHGIAVTLFDEQDIGARLRALGLARVETARCRPFGIVAAGVLP